MTKLFLDVECYPNYFLVMFKLGDGRIKYFELDENNQLDGRKIERYLSECQTIGFNSRNYDIPMIEYALRGAGNKALKILSDRIVGKEETTYDILSEAKLWCPSCYDHIDILPIPAGPPTSLKMYGARMKTQKLQDLPYEPDKILTEDEKIEVRTYCANDINLTIELYNQLQKQLEIRESITREYKIDARSLSDAKIAERLVKKSIIPVRDIEPDFEFQYKPPNYIKFEKPELQELLDKITSLTFKGVKGGELFHEDIPKTVKINKGEYSLGIGGLHSTEKNRAIVTNQDELLIDIDVVSYYPSIILNNKYAPQQFDQKEFIEFYQKIYDGRQEAKRNGDIHKSQIYKIILNSSFGKFGEQYSALYSPSLLIHTTLTGQLSLLMLIEILENADIEVVSSNTDGITAFMPRSNYLQFKAIIQEWENITNFKLEETRYKALYNESVNSYVAIKEDKTLKLKGPFVKSSLTNNAHIKVCNQAVIEYLTKGIPVEETIKRAAKTPENFTMFIKVANGGIWKGQYLGRVVRWYWSVDGEPIYRQSNIVELKKDGTPKKDVKVANSDGAWPLMDLSEPMINLDISKYIAECYKMLKQMGLDIKQEKVA